MKAKNIIFFIGLTILFSSCKDSILDLKPTDKYPIEVLYSTQSNVDAAMSEVYFESTTTFGFTKGWFPINFQYFYDAMCDDAYAGQAWINTQTFTTGALSSGNYGCFENKWNNSYAAIRTCNEFINNIGTAKIDQKLIETYKDEARFLRAFVYFDMVKLFGGVPLVFEVYDVNTVKCVSRNTSEECFNFVLTELDTIINHGNLPKSYKNLDLKWYGKVTLAAAHALRCRASLYFASKLFNPGNDRARWETAAKNSKDAIDFCIAQKISLEPNYEQCFSSPVKPYSDEVIWDETIQVDNIGTWRKWDKLDRHLQPSGYGGWSEIQPTQSLVDAYETNDGKSITDSTSGYKLNKFWENRDPRLKYTILYDSSFWHKRLVELHSTWSATENTYLPGKDLEDPANSTQTGYNYRKYLDSTWTDANTDLIRGAKHFIIFRLTELLLNYAETQIELGNEDIARKYINDVRDRASVKMPFFTASNASGATLVDRYRNERRVEMTLEGQRYNDLRRWKLAKDVINDFKVMGVKIYIESNKVRRVENIGPLTTYSFLDRNYLLPIPQHEIDVCPGIILQNEGY